MLPIAGETLTGKLAVISAIWFLMMITLDGQQPSVCWVILYVVCLLFTAGSFGIGFVLTFGQKAGTMLMRTPMVNSWHEQLHERGTNLLKN